MNKRKFFLLPICLLLLGACNLNQPQSKASEKASEPEVSEPEASSVEEQTSSECEHQFGDWTITMIPTCTEKGEETRVCSKCGASEKRDVNPLDHKWDEGVVTTIPTVEAKGVKTFTCERCQATKTEDIDKVQGIRVTFTHSAEDHFKVFVFKTKAYTTETPVETYSCYARDENGNAINFDANAALQPQVSFRVVCDEGYSVGVRNIKITGANYKNLKQGPTMQDEDPTVKDLIDETYFRITKIQGDITVTITPINGEQKVPEAEFVTSHCSVVVYKGQTIADDNIDTEDIIQARDGTSGEPVDNGDGQINFKVIPEAGYKWNHGLTADANVKDLPFVYLSQTGAAKNFKIVDAENNVYRITKVAADIAIKIRCVPEAGEPTTGHVVTFVTEHCKVLAYDMQDARFAPAELVDNKAFARLKDGDIATYVKEVKGVDANGDGDYDDEGDTAPVAEVAPQINFLVVCDEGYEFNSGVEVGAEPKADTISFISGKANKFKNVGDGVYRITKVQDNLTVTITATPKAA